MLLPILSWFLIEASLQKSIDEMNQGEKTSVTKLQLFIKFAFD